jgi:KTSC domain
MMRIKAVLGVTVAIGLVLIVTYAVRSESVQVKYRGEVNLRPFACTDIEHSSFIKRVCYDRPNEYMLISLNGIYYHYCEIDQAAVDGLLSAESKGRYYNSTIKGRFDCRTHRVPKY